MLIGFNLPLSGVLCITEKLNSLSPRWVIALNRYAIACCPTGSAFIPRGEIVGSGGSALS